MSSLNVQRAVTKINEKVHSGQKVVYGEIMKEVGYSPATCKHPKKLHGTKAYKSLMRPIVEGLQGEINRIKDALALKDLDSEELRTLVYSLDILIKNYQLLSGGATERQVFVLPSEVMQKNSIN